MTGREKFMKLAEAEREHLAKIDGLEAEARELEGNMEQLDGDALRGEVLQEEGWEAKRDSLARAKRRLAEAQDEIERARRGLEIIKSEKDNISKGIHAEILAEYKPKLQPLLKEFYKRLVAAGEAEQRIIELEEAAGREGQRFLLSPHALSLQGWGRPDLTVIRDGEFRLKEFIERCRINGFDLE